jgi:transcriptional regulator with PAS, ATPase and Fis domain
MSVFALKTSNQLEAPQILIAGRLALLALALSAASYINYFSISPVSDYIFLSLGSLFAINLILVLWLKINPASPLLLQFQSVLDISIISGIIYLSSGFKSPYLFMYLPLVFLVRIFGSFRSSVVSSLMSLTAYGTVSYLSWDFADSTILETALPQLAILSTSLSLVVIGSEHLISLINKKDLQLFESARSLERQCLNQLSLINKLPQAVIGLNKDLRIISLNSKANELLKSEANASLGTSLQSVLSEALALTVEIRSKGNLFEIISGSKKFKHEFLSVGQKNDEHLFLIFDSLEEEQTSNMNSQVLEQKLRELLVSNNSRNLDFCPKNPNFIAESKIMKKVFSLIERAAPSEATVLIQGESGTGKELVAKALHNKSGKADSAFVTVNCGAVPADLLESTFFGHKKGSFTGAITDNLGLIREADGGTLFLDEIGELPLHMQAKILRVLQEKKVRPVGGERDYDVEVRIIAATNRNLKDRVAQGQFRDDLFYRLNVINILLPALRERKEDLPILINSFLLKLSQKTKIDHNLNISSEALQLLLTYNYPGNVRELENILERSFVLGSGTILAENLYDLLPQSTTQSTASIVSSRNTEFIVNNDLELPVNLEDVLSSIERKCILLALEKTAGHRTKAADLLGINLRSFRYRTQKLGL